MTRLFSQSTSIVLAIMAAALLAGCSDGQAEPTTKSEQPSRPAVIQTVAGNALGSMSFSGVVRSAERAELAFRVPGKLVGMEVHEGDKVQEGQILAKLEQAEFLRAVNSAKVEFDKAQADYERGVQIFKSTQAIAKSDLEKLKTNRDLARNKLSNARQDLDNASLRAPFAGVIAKKTVSNFRNVNSGQAIYVLHDLDDLELVVDVPSKLFLSPARQTKAFAMVENETGVRLPVVYKSYASESDSLSQTYRVVLEFTDLNGQNVLPGMNARIYPIEDGVAGEAVIQLPVQAIVPTNTGSEFVWLVGDKGAVEKRVVKVGQLVADHVVVKDGLAVGDKVVVAGVGALTEGMKVRPLKAKGQK
ncbi:MAG: efflux RND transporter periplasmic adaptor subunit [Marinobacter sp.]